MEAAEVPLDRPLLEELKAAWPKVKQRLVAAVEEEYGFSVYDGISWSSHRFEKLLGEMQILAEWPVTACGRLSLADDTFKVMAARYPRLVLLRELRSTLIHLHDLKLTVGKDGRNRFSVAPFRSVTGRNDPASSKFRLPLGLQPIGYPSGRFPGHVAKGLLCRRSS